MSRTIRSIIFAAVAMFALLGAISPMAAQTAVTGHADFSTSDGGSAAGGSYVIADSNGGIVRQGTIGAGEQAIFFSTFVPGETYTMTVVVEGYQAVTQTLTATADGIRFNVELVPLQIAKKTLTIGVNKNGPTSWYLAEAPEGSVWTLTNLNSGKVYSGAFSGPVPQSIELSHAVGSGTYLLQIDAGPNFLPYESTVSVRGNSGALYAELEIDTSVVPMR